MIGDLIRCTVKEGLSRLLEDGSSPSITGCRSIERALNTYEINNKNLKYEFEFNEKGLRGFRIILTHQVIVWIERPKEWPNTNDLAKYLSNFANSGITDLLDCIRSIYLKYLPGAFSTQSLEQYLNILEKNMKRYSSQQFSNISKRIKYLQEASVEHLWWWACMRLNAERGHEYGKAIMFEEELRPLLNNIQTPLHGVQPTEKGSIFEGVRNGVKFTYKVKNGKVINLMASMPNSYPTERMTARNNFVALPNYHEFLEISDTLSASISPVGRIITDLLMQAQRERLAQKITEVTKASVADKHHSKN